MKVPTNAHRTARAREAGSVGIFWWWQGQVLSSSVPLAEGEAFGKVLNSPFNHMETWPAFQRQEPGLRNLDYENVPRGRVQFLKTRKQFNVLMDKTLFHPRIRTAILKTFRLPRGRTTFQTDPHYTTDVEELNQLFSY